MSSRTDFLDSDAMPLVVIFGGMLFLLVFLISVSFISIAASEDREKDISIACIESGGTWTESSGNDPATCTRS